MGWQLDGTFERINPDYTESSTGSLWYKDLTASPSIKIIATRHDVHDHDLGQGIQACLNLDGLNAMRANLDMTGYDLTAKDGTFSGDITCAGFTSTGIDDNATGERLQITDDTMTIGAAAPYNIINAANDGYTLISGGSGASAGSSIVLYGGTHATLANDIRVKGGATTQLYYDESASSWDFQANSLACAGFTSTGIDDNATEAVLVLPSNNTKLNLGGATASTDTFYVQRDVASSGAGSTAFLGGNVEAGASGGGMEVYGGLHASKADYIEFTSKSMSISDVVVGGFVSEGVGLGYWDFGSHPITTTGAVILPNLPTSDPLVAGQLWNNVGLVKVSAG